MEASIQDRVVIGLDTATDHAAVGALRAGDLLAERVVEPSPSGRARHATAVLEAIEEVVGAVGGWPRVQLIAVGVGPGSFTGLRIGIATARGLAQALGKPTAPVVSLAALAMGLDTSLAARDELRLAVLDARRGETFTALYGGAGEELWAPFVSSPEQLAERVTGLDRPLLAGGDGSIRFRRQLEATGVRVLPDEDEAHRISARQVCLLGLDAKPGPPEAIEPIYLRRPDAELWRERDRGSGTDGRS